MLGGAAGEVEQQPISGEDRAQAQLEVALGRLEHVRGANGPIGQRCKAGAGAALGVVEHRVGGLAQAVCAEAAGQLGKALRADAVGGELGAQVGSALGRLAHARHELLDRPLVKGAGGDHDALLLKRAAVGGHRPGHASPDVGVVRAAGGEAEELRAREDWRDDGDVGQVGAARERVVEDPGDAGGVVLVAEPRRRRRASSRGARGCARPA